MKKVLIVLLVAAVAMTAVFANTSDKDGFAIKADIVGVAGSYEAAYRMGDFEFGIDYMTFAPAYSLYCNVTEGFSEMTLFVVPVGFFASAQYKFIATEMHELGAFAKIGWSEIFGGFSAYVGVEYDFCFNDNHAVYVKAGYPVFPFASAATPEIAMYLADIGYRYTF